MYVILPKISSVVPKKPLFFLAGPVRGGGDWQYEMCLELERQIGDFVAAIPWRYGENHPLMQHRLPPGAEHHRQLDWEREYLEYAAWSKNPGCIIFWLGIQRSPRPPEDGPYGQDTYGEIARWGVHKLYRPETRMVMGAEHGFFGISQIQRNLEKDWHQEVHFHPTMKETAEAAIKVAQAR